MASIAEQLIGTAAQSGQQMGSNIQHGAELAQSVENIQNQRAQIEQQKQNLQLQKIDKLTSAMEKGAAIKSKSARNAFFKTYIPQMQSALGLKDFIPEDTMAMIQADPEQAKKFSLLKNKIMTGEMTYDQAAAHMEPEAWAGLDEGEVSQLEAAEKFRLQQAAAQQRTEALGGPREGNLQARREDQAAGAVNKINNDAAVKKLIDQGQRIDRDLLTLKSHPSVYTLNEIAQSIPALLGSGSVSSDFKVKEINPHTLEGEVSKLKAFIESNPNQPAPEGSIKFFSGILDRLNGAVDRQAHARAKQLGKETQTIYKTNPAAVEAVNNTVESFRKGEWRGQTSYDIRGRRLTAEQIKALPPEAQSLLPAEVKKELGIK